MLYPTRISLENMVSHQLDPRKTILYTCLLHIGQITLNLLSSTFGELPFDDKLISLRTCEPFEADTISKINNPKPNIGLLVKRGIIPFAQQFVNVYESFDLCNSECSMIIFCQDTEEWPFLVKPTKDFSILAQWNNLVDIPVLLTSLSDSKLILNIINDPCYSELCEVRIQCLPIETQCFICKKEMVYLDYVVRLRCDHSYHEECLSKFISKYCPLCTDKTSATAHDTVDGTAASSIIVSETMEIIFEETLTRSILFPTADTVNSSAQIGETSVTFPLVDSVTHDTVFQPQQIHRILALGFGACKSDVLRSVNKISFSFKINIFTLG